MEKKKRAENITRSSTHKQESEGYIFQESIRKGRTAESVDILFAWTGCK